MCIILSMMGGLHASVIETCQNQGWKFLRTEKITTSNGENDLKLFEKTSEVPNWGGKSSQIKFCLAIDEVNRKIWIGNSIFPRFMLKDKMISIYFTRGRHHVLEYNCNTQSYEDINDLAGKVKSLSAQLKTNYVSFNYRRSLRGVFGEDLEEIQPNVHLVPSVQKVTQDSVTIFVKHPHLGDGTLVLNENMEIIKSSYVDLGAIGYKNSKAVSMGRVLNDRRK